MRELDRGEHDVKGSLVWECNACVRYRINMQHGSFGLSHFQTRSHAEILSWWAFKVTFPGSNPLRSNRSGLNVSNGGSWNPKFTLQVNSFWIKIKGQNFASQVLSRHTFKIPRKKGSDFFDHRGTLSAELFNQVLRLLKTRYSLLRVSITCSHAGSAKGLKPRPQKKLWVAYPMDLKLCPNSRIVCLPDVNGFWRQKDETVLKANFHFPVIAQKVHDSERTRYKKAKCEKNVEKLQSVLTM